MDRFCVELAACRGMRIATGLSGVKAISLADCLPSVEFFCLQQIAAVVLTGECSA